MRRLVCLVSFIVFLGSPAAFGQGSSANLTGTARDASGAVLPGVTITAIHAGTNDTRTTVTSLDGLWLWRAGDSPSFARPGLDDFNWQERRVPTAGAPFKERWRGYGEKPQESWIGETGLVLLSAAVSAQKRSADSS